MIHKHAAKILSALRISDKESTQILGNVCLCLLFSSGVPCRVVVGAMGGFFFEQVE